MASYLTSIPVSIPYSWQKRLLIFALQRLDLIDIKGLDLDNLGGLTWGRRSVVELKNVSINIASLADRAKLPPSIVIEHASVTILRLTVPADLAVDSIKVEVQGVKISARVRRDEDSQSEKTASQRGKAAPNHKDTANRPRLASPSIHDPGGRRWKTEDDSRVDIAHVLPNSRDIAASFLEGETKAEREELEAIVGSQSTYMTESTSSATSSADSDTGLGLPGGFALPTFLTNYFQGVADRLVIGIADVEVSLALELPAAEQSDISENTLVLRIAGIDVESSTAPDPVKEPSKPARKFGFRGLRLDLKVDPQIFSHPSSPRLDRRSIKSSTSHLRSSMASSDFPDDAESVVLPGSTSYHASQSSNSPPIAAGRRFRGLEDSTYSESTDQGNDELVPPVSVSRQLLGSPSSSQQYPTASRLGVPYETSETPATSRVAPGNGLGIDDTSADLSESKLFTHDQAESMYASAISHAAGDVQASRFMPGGWQDSAGISALRSTIVSGARTTEPPSTPTAVQLSSERTTAHDIDNQEPAASRQDTVAIGPSVADGQGTQTSNFDFVQLLGLDFLSVMLPATALSAEGSGDAGIKDVRQTMGGSIRDPRMSTYSASLAASRLPLQSSMQAQSLPTGAQDSADKLKISAGQLRFDVDLGICKLLVKIAAGVLPRISSPEQRADRKDDSSVSATEPAGLSISLGELLLNFHEGRHFRASIGLGRGSSQPSTDDALLSLSLGEIALMQTSASHRDLNVSTIKIRHAARDVLRFVDTVNVRESIASSAMLRQHDLTVLMDGQRTEVFTKSIECVIDLLLVDEVLSKSGGLDSLIDLGTSILSTQSSKGTTQKSETKPQTRSVRFNDPSNRRTRADSDPPVSIGKLNIRVNGAIIHLDGSESSMQVRTSAIKFVMRPAAARVVIDGMIVEGPLLTRSTSHAPLYTRLKGLEIIYCETPEEKDLDRLLSLITPSNDKYDDEDDIMVDTLLKQRRKGGVIRLDLNEMQVKVNGLDWQQQIVKLSDELVKLTAVTKYLPEDDRPGILTFGLLHKIDLSCNLDPDFGSLAFRAELLEAAHISVPALTSAQVSSWSVVRNKDDVIIGEVLPQDDSIMGPPMLMCRFIADEMEPTVRLKLTNTCVEYKVPTLVAVTDLLKKFEKVDVPPREIRGQLSPSSSRSSDMSEFARKVKVLVTFRDSAAALNPVGSRARGLFVLIDTTLGYEAQKTGALVDLKMRKAALLIVNDSEMLQRDADGADNKRYFDQTDQIQSLTKLGYVPVTSLSSANVRVQMIEDSEKSKKHTDIELSKPLLFMETCADSTQTLFSILGGLSPPSAPSTQAQYRTEIVPIEDMLASFTGNAYVSDPGPRRGVEASRAPFVPTLSRTAEMEESDLLGGMYDEESDELAMDDSYVESDAGYSATSSVHIAPVDVLAPNEEDLMQSVMVHSMLDFREDHFDKKTNVGGTAHRWNSTRNTYELANEAADEQSPLKVKVRDLHVIWNLFDGYDWQETRETISQAVRDIEEKAMSRRQSGRTPAVEEEEDVIGDVLFNSIYISIPANKDPRDLTSAINHNIDDMMSETGSYATSTTVTATPSRQMRRQSGMNMRPKKLKLDRSKHHKISFELQGVAADFVALPPGSGEVQSSVDVRVHKLEIFDNVPTSTWKKFATYLHDAGEREVDTSMVHVEMLNVQPVPDLAASEIVMKITILPLRLHVDQDALDFMTRFFEFKDDSAPSSSTPSTPPFIQRVEVNPVRLQLDYKPKKVDYAGLRSGRTTEFMNFIILERTSMVLRRVILYGVSGFDRMGIMLNNIWSPDVRRNQLPTVLAGLAPVRPFVDVASGVRELIAVPIREYQKDGRIVRSIQKGAVAFAKTTATELINLGAKLAIGTQQVLQNAEGVLVPGQYSDDDSDSEATKQISLYADQPVGILQGMRGAYASLERDLLLARDAIVAVPGEVMANGTAVGAAKAVLRQGPTIILRPAIGATKAVGQTLMGAGNTLDPRNLRRVEDVRLSCLLVLKTLILTVLAEIQETLKSRIWHCHRCWKRL